MARFAWSRCADSICWILGTRCVLYAARHDEEEGAVAQAKGFKAKLAYAAYSPST